MIDMGDYQVVSDVRTPECSLRLLRLTPGKRVSPHFHRRTTQIYFLLEGSAVVQVGPSLREIGPNQTCRVPPGTAHAISSQVVALVLSISIPPLEADDQHPSG